MNRSVAAARSTRAAACSTSETAETAAAFSPEDVFESAGHDDVFYGGCLLEGEIDAAAGHGEVILWPIDNAPAQIIGPADVTSEPKFKTESEMADRFCLSIEMMTLRVDGGKLIR